MEGDYIGKLGRVLRVSQDRLREVDVAFSRVSGKKNVLHTIVDKNDEIVAQKLSELGVRSDARTHEVYDALISRVESDDLELLSIIGHRGLRGYEAARRVVDFVGRHCSSSSGFFLKHAKARSFLLNTPPRKIMRALGYDRVEDLVEKENLLEIYSALRFLEDRSWQNEVFFKQYEQLTPDDFEERPLEIHALPDKWATAAERFVAKKYHNVSHLKELGVIFVIPVFLKISGETLRLLSLLFHYTNEIHFYSSLFKDQFARDRATFAQNLISTLRGDILEDRNVLLGTDTGGLRILVVQRYLAKDDENDWRLSEPRINPEALHWVRAEHQLAAANNLEFWQDADWVGDFFKSDEGVDILVSFDLVDTVMALVKRKELLKYLYHHQEALWNKIFIEHFGVERLEELSKEHITRGYFEL